MADAQPQQETDADKHFNTIQEGRFVEKRDDGYLFEFDDGEKALVSADEYQSEENFDHEPGDEVRLLVERPIGGHWSASVRKAEKLDFWERLGELAESGEIVPGEIVAENKGGLSVDIGIRAFCPRSQIDMHKVSDASPYVGRKDDFQVIQFDKKRGNIVVSRRKVLEKRREREKEEIVENLEEGQIFTGVVRNLKKYGAFIDIGGIDGLLHVSNMSWGRIDHPSELVRPGDEIEVVVLEYDEDRERLSLGRKQLLDNPWDNIEENFSDGDVTEGEVVSLADFGAFVEVAPGLEGLVHVTELAWTGRINHPKDVLDLGQNVRVKVIDVDTDKKRLGLSIKRLEKNPWEELAASIEPGQVVEGPIRNITDFGLFVEVAPDVEGLVHVSDISWTEKIDDPSDHFKVGDDVEAKVLDIDVDNQRLSLGIKQLSKDPWSEAKEVAKPGEKIKVEITRLMDFGAFAEVVPGVEGLIHISELAEERVENVHSVVRPGQNVEALVLSFDRSNERIGLSLKRDELGAEKQTEYTEDGGSATLGDIFRDRLGLDGDEGEEAE
ncbi:MAG: 30S ribosomal protein S1, partial [Myxococcota bacterium]